MSDRRLLYTAAFLRAVGTGMIGVLLGIYLARLHYTPARIGVVVTVGLAGTAFAAFVATFAGDRVGRRRFLLALAVLSGIGGVVVAVASPMSIMVLAAFFGMVNGMGRDRGAALVLEQAVLPSMTGDTSRTRAFAVYNVFQDVGHAIGGLLAGVPSLLHRFAGTPDVLSARYAVGIYALIMLSATVLYTRLSPRVESASATAPIRVSRETRGVLWKISALFSLDSLGGGFLTAALLSFFFFERFHATEGVVSLLFFGARVANAVSHLGAAWLAKRIGLVNTMVFTHVPSSLLLVTVAFAPSFLVAAILFLLREGLVEMDVPTRQSYVMAVVRPEERTVASGVTTLVRTGAWAVAPSFAGVFMQNVGLAAPLFIGAGMKIAYDVLLYVSFRAAKPPEERTTPAADHAP